MCGGFIGSAFIKRFGIKKTLIISSIMFVMVIFCQTFPAWYDQVLNDPENVQGKLSTIFTNRKTVEAILIISSAMTGTGVGLMWVAQGEYVSNCSSEQHKGYYFGYFWAWYMFA